MKAKLLRIKNVLGVSHAEIKLGKVTEIRGRNGTGKTSTLEAIKAVFGGGTDATLRRVGTDDGEAVVVLDDDVTLRKPVATKGQSLIVKHPEYGTISAGQTFASKAVDAFAMNPLDLITARPADRAKYLLEAMPLRVSDENLQAALVDIDPVIVEWNGFRDRHAFETIAHVRKQVFDARTAENRSVRDKRSTIAQLSEAVDGTAEDPDTLRDAIRTKRNAIEIAHNSITEALADAYLKFMARTHEVREKADAEVQKIRRKAEAEIRLVRENTTVLVEEAQAERDAVRVSLREKHDTSALASEVARLESDLEVAVRASSTRNTIEAISEELAGSERVADALTGALDRLDALRSNIASELPIDVEIGDDGELYRDGVPFARLNRTEQVKIALAVAKARSADLKLICIDGLELMDEATYRAFVDAALAEDDGVQYIVTRVTDDESLTVVTDGELFDHTATEEVEAA